MKQQEKILIVDDNETNLKILGLILSKTGYETKGIKRPKEVITTLDDFAADLILLDINMPEMDGFELCSLLKQDPKSKEIPVIFISALSDSNAIVDGFSLGAVDYITKPFKAEEVKVRVATHLKIHELQQKLEEHNRMLEQKVQEQVKKISDTQMETIFSLAKLAQSRDDDTGKHLERVQKYCYVLAIELQKDSPYSSQITDEFIKNIVFASPLHDIGKVGIADAILLKPGRFTPEEFEIMKTHTIIGAKTLEEVDNHFGDNSFINMGKVIARSHHERWDGNGYPDKLKAEEIPLAARIMSIADVYDALTARRVYKEPFSQEKSIQIIQEGAGSQFDPIIVEAFLKVAPEFEKIKVANND